MEHEIPHNRCGDETRKGEDVGDRVDVLMWGYLRKYFEKRLFGLGSCRSGSSLLVSSCCAQLSTSSVQKEVYT